jgi:hexosaminidase
MKFSLAAAAAFLLAAVDAKTLLFPIPQTVDWTGSEAAVANNFEITGAKNAYVKDAAKRYTKLIFEESWVPVPISAAETLKSAASLKSLDISVKDNNAKLDTGIDESYELNVPSSGGKATLTANTWVGALRGLETFSQLVQRKKGGNKNQIAAHTAKITDAPTYGHRGIMLDTSRNFYPVKDILRTLDGMSMNKMNVLHWHATDSQSWPLYYKSHPEISKNGAYSQDEVYNPSDVQKIIKYAESRGIRVILELDMPAHTDTISMSHPDLMACHGMWWGPLASEPPSGQLNVIHKGTVDLMNELVSEALETFPDTYFHAGGDEINLKCWETNDEMTKYAKDKGVGLDQLWYDFTNNMIAHVKKGKKKSIIWEDSIKDGGKISTDTTVQTWLNPPGNYTSKGYDVIVTNYDYFYLDCGHGGMYYMYIYYEIN